MNRVLLILGVLWIQQSFAVQCAITLVKDNCWNGYQVKVEISDRVTDAILANIEIPKNQSWSRVKFSCRPGQILAAKANFSPEIFVGDGQKFFSAVRFWDLPQQEPSSGSIWAIEMCYGAQFSNLPIPPKSTGHCQCDTSLIPPIQN